MGLPKNACHCRAQERRFRLLPTPAIILQLHVFDVLQSSDPWLTNRHSHIHVHECTCILTPVFSSLSFLSVTSPPPSPDLPPSPSPHRQWYSVPAQSEGDPQRPEAREYSGHEEWRKWGESRAFIDLKTLLQPLLLSLIV